MPFEVIFLQILFYLFIPGAGALYTRRRWRKFRASLMNAVVSEPLGYSHLTREDEKRCYSYIGSLEALEDSSVLWLRNRDVTVSADLSGSRLYVLPQVVSVEALPQESPEYLPWSRIPTFEEGSRVLLYGNLRKHMGFSQFLSTPGESLLTVLSHAENRDFYKLAVWSGRQRNEYWNFLTPWSLTGGILAFLSLFFINYFSGALRTSLFALSAAFIPLMCLLPPGLFFFLLYRRFWMRARRCRAERDLVRLYHHYYSHLGLHSVEGSSSLDPFESKPVLLTCEEVKKFKVGVSEASSPVLSHRPELCGTICYLGVLRKRDDQWYLSGDDEGRMDYCRLPGRPEALAQQLTGRAYRLETSGLILISVGLIINYVLTLFLLAAVF